MRIRYHHPPRPCNAVGTCGIPVVSRGYYTGTHQYPLFTSACGGVLKPQDCAGNHSRTTFTPVGNQLDRYSPRQTRLAPCRKLNEGTAAAPRTVGISSGSIGRMTSIGCVTAVRTVTRAGTRRTLTRTVRPARKRGSPTQKPIRNTTSCSTSGRANSSRGRGSSSSGAKDAHPGSSTPLYVAIARRRRHIATPTDRAGPFQKFSTAGPHLSRSTVGPGAQSTEQPVAPAAGPVAGDQQAITVDT